MATSPTHRFGQIIGDLLEIATVEKVRPVATQTPVKREPAEPQGFIKPTGAGIPRLQAGEEANNERLDRMGDRKSVV